MAKSFKDALSKTNITEKTGISNVFSSTEPKQPINQVEQFAKSFEIEPTDEPEYIRQTFLLDTQDFERLKDIIHFKKTNVDFDYSQKQALHDAIELLYNSVGPIPPRPEFIRKKEIAKTATLKKKRQANKAK